MAEKKSTKAKSTRRKAKANKAEIPNQLCQGKLSDVKPCPKTVEKGKVLCLWHNSEDEIWGEIYARLESTPQEQKTGVVLGLIKSHPEHKLELPVWNGQVADLSGVDLSNIDLQNARLPKVNLQDAVLRAANLRGALLAHANLQDAFLEDADLQEANLMHATLQAANFKNANMGNANLRYANLRTAYLENTNLKNAQLLEATLQNSNLQGADLEGADLSATNLENSYLNRAKLMMAHLDEANLQGTNLGGAVLKNAHLYAADLRDAHLVLADLTGANLNSANLQGANLRLADLRAADLTEAKLQGVDLSIASNISNLYLDGAWLDRTRMNPEKLGGSIGEELNNDYTGAKRGYLALKQNFDDLGDYDAVSWAYCKERQMEKLEAWQNGWNALSKHEWRKATINLKKSIFDLFLELLCNYGESTRQVIAWMAFLLFVVGPLLFSGLGGFVWSDSLTNDYFAQQSSWHRLGFWYYHYLLYTLDVLTTASFSGLQPINDWVKLASGFFAIAGIFLVGLLGFVAGNRIRRS